VLTEKKNSDENNTVRADSEYYQQNVVEEKHFALMSVDIFLLVDVGDFTETTIADETSTWHRQLLHAAHTRQLSLLPSAGREMTSSLRATG